MSEILMRNIGLRTSEGDEDDKEREEEIEYEKRRMVEWSAAAS